jgi:hypothetical protein
MPLKTPAAATLSPFQPSSFSAKCTLLENYSNHPLLPLRRIAAGMKARDDKQAAIVIHDKQQRVGEAAQEGAAHVLVDNGKLQRVGADAFGHSVNRGAETTPEAGRFAFIPILRVDQFRTGGLREMDRIHLGATLL